MNVNINKLYTILIVHLESLVNNDYQLFVFNIVDYLTKKNFTLTNIIPTTYYKEIKNSIKNFF
jgi:hypothetical protein